MAPEYLFGLIVALALAGAAAVGVATEPDPIAEPTILDGDGTACTFVGSELVPADPRALAAAVDMAPGTYALARAIVSEATSSRAVRIAVGCTILNYARAHGRTLLKLITDVSHDGVGDGYFGRQAQGRYVASSQDTTDEVRALAVEIVAGEIEDPTGGAEHFDSPRSYGVQKGTDASGADRFASKREAEGFELVTLPGVPATTIRFWRPV